MRPLDDIQHTQNMALLPDEFMVDPRQAALDRDNLIRIDVQDMIDEIVTLRNALKCFLPRDWFHTKSATTLLAEAKRLTEVTR